MPFKKNPTTEELQTEVEKLQTQVVEGNAKFNALQKQFNNHPAKQELEVIKSKWWFRLITWSW